MTRRTAIWLIVAGLVLVVVGSVAATTRRSSHATIGSRADGHSSDSTHGLVKALSEHAHTASQVYPTLADGVTVTGDSVAWTLGAFAAVVPASTITSDFDIHHVSLENISANDVYELVLYYGAADTEAGRVRITQNAVQSGTLNVPMHTVIIPADSQIRAKVASAGGTSRTVDISIFYHTY